jgi:hypothetical protein
MVVFLGLLEGSLFGVWRPLLFAIDAWLSALPTKMGRSELTCQALPVRILHQQSTWLQPMILRFQQEFRLS